MIWPHGQKIWSTFEAIPWLHGHRSTEENEGPLEVAMRNTARPGDWKDQ